MSSILVTLSCFIILYYGLSTACFADVRTDGSVGAAQNLSGPDYQIPAQLGQQTGVNLFHSFQQFSLATGESATFSGPDSVQRIFSRVTGGDTSLIDGTIRNQINGADLYLLNPAGVIFGKNARLETSGSFYVSTADQVLFQDGSIFSSDLANSSTFTTAAPEAFGFLSNTPAAIEVNAPLTVPDGETLALIGGDISVQGDYALDEQGEVKIQTQVNGQTVDIKTSDISSFLMVYTPVFTTNLQALSGKLYLASLDQAGQVVLTPSELKLTDAQGNLLNNAGGNIYVYRALLNTKGNDSGSVFIQGGAVTLEEMQLWNRNINGESGVTSFNADELHILGGTYFTGINASSLTLGKANTLLISANNALFEKGVSISADGLDQSGCIKINVGNDFYFLGQPTQGHYIAGQISNSANLLSSEETLTEPLSNDGFTHIVVGGDFHLLDGAEVGGISLAVADAPNLTLEVGGELYIAGALRLPQLGNSFVFNSGIISNSYAGSMMAKYLQYPDVPVAGKSGEIYIKADKISLDNEGIIVNVAHQGNAGSIKLEVRELSLLNSSFIAADILGAGTAGSIEIYADKIYIQDDNFETTTHSQISSDSSRNVEGMSQAGHIKIVANTVALIDNAAITARTKNATGGNIDITVNDMLLLVNGGRLTTNVRGGDQNSGNIYVKSNRFVVLNNGEINAQAIGGNGGNITIQAEHFLSSTNSLISAASQLGIDGSVYILSPKIDLEDRVLVLSEDFLEASNQFVPKCDLEDIKQAAFNIDLQRSGRMRAPNDFLE